MLNSLFFIVLSTIYPLKEALDHHKSIIHLEEEGDPLQLAIAYYKEQDYEEAFRSFLQALDEVKTEKSDPNDEELKLYNELLQVYLIHDQEKLREKISQVPDTFHLIGFFHSGIEANLGHYDAFFTRFYNSYRHYPNHYLAYKTKAILYIKLFERELPGEKKEGHRMNIVSHLKNAIDQYPHDPTLYKMLFTFSTDDVRPYLKKIIEENIMVPRADIMYYVQQAIEMNEITLAEQFINNEREMYQYSRAVIAAENYLQTVKESIHE